MSRTTKALPRAPLPRKTGGAHRDRRDIKRGYVCALCDTSPQSMTLVATVIDHCLMRVCGACAAGLDHEEK